MLKDATGFDHIYIACGSTDLRKGIAGLLMIIENEFYLNPFHPNSIYLFCGRRSNTIKAIVMEDDGCLLLTKKLNAGRYQWPRSSSEVKDISEEQFKLLMDGFEIERRSTIRKTTADYI